MIDPHRPETEGKNAINYERLGKAVEDALILDYIYVLHSTRRQIWSAFVRGVFAGIGGVLGATVGVTVLVALLQLFGGAPLIGHYIQGLVQTIQGDK